MISGYGNRPLSDISISQTQTRVMVHGKPKWGVTITNKYFCAQNNVILNCIGFDSIESYLHEL